MAVRWLTVSVVVSIIIFRRWETPVLVNHLSNRTFFIYFSYWRVPTVSRFTTQVNWEAFTQIFIFLTSKSPSCITNSTSINRGSFPNNSTRSWKAFLEKNMQRSSHQNTSVADVLSISLNSKMFFFQSISLITFYVSFYKKESLINLPPNSVLAKYWNEIVGFCIK